ncbi:uncharacterized protein LOC127786981 [Diospyros lotus]|uniref:uncharacterized protein LOC127786981 n=1 Tax=Diospyros lotus TaxID=55363 RepID=UPI002251ED61|nr:uncharacterized protein LOC127786981 [Diospyros lotus]
MASLKSDTDKLSAEETAGEDFSVSATEPESTEKAAADSVVSPDHEDEVKEKEEGALGGEEDEPLDQVLPTDEEFSIPPASTPAFGDDEEADPGATDDDDDNDDVE